MAINQEEGIDYDETFAPVARLEAIRMLLAFACYKDFKEYLYETDSVLYDLLKNKMSDFLWSNFEEDLGYLDFSDEISYYYREIEDGFDSYSAVNNMVVTLYECR